ncbi:hypothetical protein HMPREF9182_0002 [Streptococcus sp. oral taxon 056 str. F0418]|nr:hypothetical protein HMPREF9182_0002 [Streptococcus sp. oral taxon 056 str. F0418]
MRLETEAESLNEVLVLKLSDKLRDKLSLSDRLVETLVERLLLKLIDALIDGLMRLETEAESLNEVLVLKLSDKLVLVETLLLSEIL